MVIMACNTCSALALEMVQNEFDLPILGIILPGASAAAKQGKRIGVLATPATAASHAYRQAIQEIDESTQVWEIGCPAFVPLIEQNRLYDPYTEEVTQQYLEPLLNKNIDTLVYGCTHYRHLAPVLRKNLPEAITLVDPAQYVVAAAERELELMGLKSTRLALPTRFCVSGSPETFAHLSQQWLGCTPDVEKIHLQPVSATSTFLHPD